MTWDYCFLDTYRLRRVDLESFLRKLLPKNNKFDITFGSRKESIFMSLIKHRS